MIGVAACSTLWAKPNTRPCRSGGTTFWRIVCSAASTTGIRHSQTNIPAASSTIDDWSVKTAQTVHMAMLARNSVRSGLRPQPLLGDDQPADDEAQAQEAPQRAPDLHRHQQQAVGVHQRHEDAAQEVVEGLKRIRPNSPGTAPDRPDRARGRRCWSSPRATVRAAWRSPGSAIVARGAAITSASPRSRRPASR